MLSKLEIPKPTLLQPILPQSIHEQYMQDLQAAMTYRSMFEFGSQCAHASYHLFQLIVSGVFLNSRNSTRFQWLVDQGLSWKGTSYSVLWSFLVLVVVVIDIYEFNCCWFVPCFFCQSSKVLSFGGFFLSYACLALFYNEVPLFRKRNRFILIFEDLRSINNCFVI